MEDRETAEAQFVDAFIVKHKRDRYREALRSSKKRRKTTYRFDHNPDLDFERAVALDGAVDPGDLFEEFCSDSRKNSCWLISSDPNLDGKSVSVPDGMRMIENSTHGAVLICPPKPFAIYRQEPVGKTTWYFFS